MICPKLIDIQVINIDKKGLYPYEVCLNVHPVERGWFPYMVCDDCCLHSMMFSVRAFLDGTPSGGRISRQAAFHHARTLQILQTRLDAFQQGQWDVACSDSTIIVIIFLAAAAEHTGDLVAVENHVYGLLEIVRLRGGVKAMNTHNNLQVKVCRYASNLLKSKFSEPLLEHRASWPISDEIRADLGLALRLGRPARLFQEGIVWDCFIADSGVIHCTHEPFKTQVDKFVDVLGSDLGNCWKDLHTFACMSNLAYQTTRKLSPDTYNEMMISIFYRLMHLSFEEGCLQEAVRVALLIFSSTLFLTSLYVQPPLEHLLSQFRGVLSRICQSTDLFVPQPIMLWLMVLYHVTVSKQYPSDDWQSICFARAISHASVSTWSEARSVLKSVMWVAFVHETHGKKAFEATVQHLRSVVDD